MNIGECHFQRRHKWFFCACTLEELLDIFIPIIHPSTIPQLRTVPTTAFSRTHWDKQDSFVGGIIGCSDGSFSVNGFVYNCLNHGPITRNGTASGELNIEGIVGYTEIIIIGNCVSSGKISVNKTRDNRIGSIVGHVF